jgi:hypothetical protein
VIAVLTMVAIWVCVFVLGMGIVDGVLYLAARARQMGRVLAAPVRSFSTGPYRALRYDTRPQLADGGHRW